MAKLKFKDIKRHVENGSFFRTSFFGIIFKLDAWFIASCLSFNNYYQLQKRLGFPIERLKFRQVHGYYPNYKNPKSFNEKCNFLKLYSRNPVFPIIADKYKARDFVEKKVGKEILIPLLQVADRAEEINFKELPNQFIIKTNFSSGQNIIVKNKSAVNYSEVTKKLNYWMNMKYRIKELIWFAQEMDRKIIVEELLSDPKGMLPVDYKFYVFSGRVKMIQVIENREVKKSLTHFDRSWNFLNFRKGSGDNNEKALRPENLDEMIEIAEKLGAEFDFMRVDLFSISGKIYFGELTPYPGNGRSAFKPSSYDLFYGNCWEMDLSHLI